MTSRSTISKFITNKHRRASRALGFALILGDFNGWNSASLIWIASLTDVERAALAYASLMSLDPENRDLAVDAVLGGAGMPHAAFLSAMDQAAHWADMASGGELDAYALACFNRLSPARQNAFLGYVQRRAA